MLPLRTPFLFLFLQFKVRPVYLGLIPANITWKIITTFLELDFLLEEQRSDLTELIGYNGRSIQFFLQVVKIKFPETTTSDNVTYEVLLQCANNAYDEWLAIILNTKVMRLATEEETHTILGELLLVFAYPASVGAEERPDGSVRFTPAKVFPSKWREFAEAGAFRVLTSSDNHLDLYPPKGFLLRWVTNSFARRVIKS